MLWLRLVQGISSYHLNPAKAISVDFICAALFAGLRFFRRFFALTNFGR